MKIFYQTVSHAFQILYDILRMYSINVFVINVLCATMSHVFEHDIFTARETK